MFEKIINQYNEKSHYNLYCFRIDLIESLLVLSNIFCNMYLFLNTTCLLIVLILIYIFHILIFKCYDNSRDVAYLSNLIYRSGFKTSDQIKIFYEYISCKKDKNFKLPWAFVFSLFVSLFISCLNDPGEILKRQNELYMIISLFMGMSVISYLFYHFCYSFSKKYKLYENMKINMEAIYFKQCEKEICNKILKSN